MEYKRKDFLISKSPIKTKKYRARLRGNTNDYVDFGAIKKDGKAYEQYIDRTKLKLYKDYDHNDVKRQKRYIMRHKNDIKRGFNAGWLSYIFLWS